MEDTKNPIELGARVIDLAPHLQSVLEEIVPAFSESLVDTVSLQVQGMGTSLLYPLVFIFLFTLFIPIIAASTEELQTLDKVNQLALDKAETSMKRVEGLRDNYMNMRTMGMYKPCISSLSFLLLSSCPHVCSGGIAQVLDVH